MNVDRTTSRIAAPGDVDTGLHALGWSREQAIDYMLARMPSSKEELAQEVATSAVSTIRY